MCSKTRTKCPAILSREDAVQHHISIPPQVHSHGCKGGLGLGLALAAVLNNTIQQQCRSVCSTLGASASLPHQPQTALLGRHSQLFPHATPAKDACQRCVPKMRAKDACVSKRTSQISDLHNHQHLLFADFLPYRQMVRYQRRRQQPGAVDYEVVGGWVTV